MDGEGIIAVLITYMICSLLWAVYNCVVNYLTLKRIPGDGKYYMLNCLSSAMTLKCIQRNFELAVLKNNQNQFKSIPTVQVVQNTVYRENGKVEGEDIYEDFENYYSRPPVEGDQKF